MKLQIKDFAELTGVSVRTLHYYDEIGLLKPSEVDDCSGYRYYDSSCLDRMREILFYREMDFSLKSIAQILSSPDYDKEQALRKQRQLLVLKKNRLEMLIAAIDSAEKGDFEMNNEYEKTRSSMRTKRASAGAIPRLTKRASSVLRTIPRPIGANCALGWPRLWKALLS